MDGGFLLDEAALGILCRGLGGLGDDVDALDDGAHLGGLHREHAAGLAAVVAAEDLHRVAFLDM